LDVETARQRSEKPSVETAAPPRSDKPAFWFLGAGIAATLLHFALPAGWQNQWQDVVGLASVVAIVAGTRYNRPQNASAWYAMALGQLLFVVGDVVWTSYEVVLHRELPFPSFADAAYLAGYLPLAIGLAIVIRARRPGRDANGLIDAAIVTVAASVGAWLFLMAPQVSGEGATALVSIAYPAADVLLIAVAARLVFTADTRAFSYRLIAASLIALVVADVFFVHATFTDSYSTGSPIDAGWLFSYVFWGAAALHPSMRILTQRISHPDPPRYTRRRLATEATAVFAIPLMWTVQTLRGAPSYTGIVVGGSTIAALLVVSRTAGLMKALESAALHDPLTGLPNRRLLLDRIGQAFRRAERTNGLVGVLFLDLGGFKKVNDHYGHEAGDQALVEIGQRLQAAVRASDTVARLGGDEFVILCEGIDRSDADALAHRVRAHVSMPINIQGNWVEITVDLGIALEMVPAEGNVAQLLSAADRAMYRAKHAAKALPERQTTAKSEDG
jgi:diguanylate cyclase (GGDEF)-like protein